MNPIFHLPYSEFIVADELTKKIKGSSVWIPTSAQEKGIDLLLYKRVNNENKLVTIQVKASRAYMHMGKYNYKFWLNRFTPNPNADFFAITGIYPKIPYDKKDPTGVAIKEIEWNNVILIFTYQEMLDLMSKVVTIKEEKPDKMWEFSFNSPEHIFLTRGKSKGTEITDHLLKKKISEIENHFNK